MYQKVSLKHIEIYSKINMWNKKEKTLYLNFLKVSEIWAQYKFLHTLHALIIYICMCRNKTKQQTYKKRLWLD